MNENEMRSGSRERRGGEEEEEEDDTGANLDKFWRAARSYPRTSEPVRLWSFQK